jgi:hypothetical protein
MKRLLLVAALLLIPSLARAQNTSVTATVLDPSNRAYAFSTGYAALVCPGNQQPTFNGYTVPRTFTIVGFDGNGTFTQTVYDVNSIQPAGCGYQWHITYQDGITAFITGTITTVTGASVNLSTSISSFAVPLPVSAGQVLSVSGSAPIVSSGGVAPTISCPTCIAGSLASPQVPFGSGANTVSGSNNFEYVPASGGLLITTDSAVGPTNVLASGLAMVNGAGGSTAYMIKHNDGAFILRNDSALIPAKGFFEWDANGTMLLEGGANGAALTFYTGASISPFGNGSAILDIFASGGSPHVFAVTADQGAGDKGYFSIDPFTNAITFGGDVSGSAAIGTATAAGTPNKINLPTTTGTAGQVLQTDGGNPQQTSWVNPAITVMTTGTYTNATTTPSNITGLTFAVLANTNYRMTCNLYFQGSVNTAGLDIAITGPSAPTTVFYSLDEDSTSATNINSVASSFGTKLVAQNITATTNFHAMVTMGLRNGANAGNIQVQGSATGAGTVTVQPGSFCTLQ